MDRKICDVFFNIGSGSESDQRYSELMRLLKDKGMNVARSWKVDPSTGADFKKALSELEASDTPFVVVAGGDGTLSGVATALVSKKKLLGAVPSGTFNYFARNLKIPDTSMEDAVANLLEGREIAVSIGKVNAVHFLNNASFGLYPTALKTRERHYKRWGRGRIIACYSLVMTLLASPKIYRIRMRSASREDTRATPFVFVGTNEFQIDSMGLRGQGCIAKSCLAVYVTECLGFGQRVWLALKAVFRNLADSSEYRVSCASSLHVEFRRPRIRVAVDGEVRTLEAPLEFSLEHEVLRVIVP